MQFDLKQWNEGIGLMSGTSMDGVDLACCSFRLNNHGWEYRILQAETIPYPVEWYQLLAQLPAANGEELIKADRMLGRYFGELTAQFCKKHNLNPVYVASHGHTVFHQPGIGYTFQAGHGASIAEASKILTITDFRSQDVAAGGQGAPLVPIGDELLFSQYDALLNIGGFANISLKKQATRIAWDICPVNIVLNHLARKNNKTYDSNGEMARSGHVIESLLQQLNDLSFYKQSPPRSLGREWVDAEILPMLDIENHPLNDLIATYTYHAAVQIAHSCNEADSVLCSGGGVHNQYLMELVSKHSHSKIIVSDDITCDFKEALIFAFLGWLRLNTIENTLISATGARKAFSSGALYLP